MLTEKSRLVIPLVFWGSKAPRSRILQISSVQNGKVIVTGSVDGIVMQWLVDESLGWMQPQMMLLAHDTAICCISPISTAVSTSKFITCSEDGHVCLWDSADGRIIDSLRTNYVHRKMKPYTKKGLQEVIFCVGDYSDVVALHPHDLNVLYTLNSRSEPDWITSFTLVQPAEKHDVLIGVSVSGVAKLWSLHDSNLKENGVNELFEDESKFISSRNVSTVAFSEKNVRMMLVICGNSWQIIDPSDLSQLILSECAIEALEGVIVDIDKVAIGFADSTIVLFQLPRSKLRGRQIRERFGNKPANVANIEQPFVFALLKGLATNPEKPLLNPAKFYFDSKLNPDNKTHRRIAYRVDEQSTISFWHVPKNLELLVSEFVRTKRPIVYEPTIRQNLADAWSRLNSVPPSIAEIEDGLAVTATVYVPTQGKLFLGREDGSIVMTNACHAIMVALLEGFGNEKAPYRLLKDGHVGPINCFLYPFGENVRYDPNVLLSGGADFSVVVWNITLGELTHRFCCQGGPVTRILVPPANCSSRVLNCICSIASDNSACLLSLKELKCILLASRQQFPIIDVRWRPLDDLLLLRCEDDSVYVWQIETGNLDRIITGLVAGEIMEACNEQFGLSYEGTEDEAGASQAVQMLRALKHKNVASLRKIAGQMDGRNVDTFHYSADTNLTPALDIIHLNNCSDTTHLVLFNVDALISGLLSLDYEVHQHSAAGSELNQMRDGRVGLNDLKIHNGTLQSLRDNSPSAFSLEATQNIQTANNRTTSTPTNLSGLLQQHSLYMDTAKLLITLIYAWNMDDNVDGICTDSLKLSRPRIPLCFGTMSKGHISLYTPYSSGKIPALDDFSFKYYSRSMHWQLNRVLTTIHLLAVVSLSNTLMALRNRAYELSSRKTPLRRALSTKSASEQMNETESQQIKQGWSSVAALHCVLLPDFVRPRHSYASPRIDMLARKWQDSCIEIRDAAQALLIRELNRLGGEGRQQMIENWANFLPTQLDPSISIFGAAQLSTTNNPASTTQNHVSTQQNNHANNDGTSTESSSNQKEMMSSPSLLTSGGANSTTATDSFPKTPPPRPSVPPIPPRSSNSGSSLPTILTIRDDESNSINSTSRQNLRISPITTVVGSSFSSLDDQESIQTQLSGQIYCGGVHQIRRNQATAVIVLGVMGTEFASELQGHMDICRSTAHSLLELLLAPESPMVPVPHNSLLRRAAIDLLGRGFVIWQPHLDLSKVLIGLLNLAADCERYMQMNSPQFGAQLSPEADACRTARHALTLIASSRPQALITALNMEVVRYNAVVQHQTIQNPINSSLMKSRNEVLRLLEHLSEKQYNFVVDLIVPIGEILVHCLDLSLLKQRSLAELFPPIARFYMVAYCPTTRRLAFGGKNGVIVIHELRASKAQSVKAHGVPITALAFSQDGKYLAAYAAQEAKISFWQAQQTFLGMGQSQIRCAKTLPAPGEFPVISPGGSYQLFRARLVWINSKSLTLMLPNGKENRFSI